MLALVIVVPGTAVAKDIPTGDTIYSWFCETDDRQKLFSTFCQSVHWL